MLNNSTVLITGGTGSLGKALVATILERWPEIRRLVIFSRDELKQSELAQEFPVEKFPALRFFLGDVRDRDRLRRAFSNVDIVIHAAALKQVPAAEYNPMEFVRTNVTGAENVIEAAIDAGVRKVVALSTDKAAAPVNLYGATKLCSDKLFVAANAYSGANLQCAIVRYGNVMASRGSVIPFFLKQRLSGALSITDREMTRFNITLEEGVNFVLSCVKSLRGGEIFVPKLPSYRVVDVAEAIGPSCSQDIIGLRPGEKIHEEMITVSDSYSTLDHGTFYSILPATSINLDVRNHYLAEGNARPVEKGFSYNSRDNDKFLTIDEIRQLMIQNVDQDFRPV